MGFPSLTLQQEFKYSHAIWSRSTFTGTVYGKLRWNIKQSSLDIKYIMSESFLQSVFPIRFQIFESKVSNVFHLKNFRTVSQIKVKYKRKYESAR